MTPDVIIRRFRPADAPGTHDVFIRAVHIGAAGHYTPEQLHDWVPDRTIPEDWGPWLGDNITVVAEDRGRITGFFMLEPSGYLNMTFVAPEERRSGLADLLYAAILAEARGRGMTGLTVWASRLAHRFLSRQGWVIDPDPPPLAGHPVATDDPEPIDNAMKLSLEPAT